MRVSRSILLLLLLSLASPVHVRAETTVYLMGRALEVPPPVVLFIVGLALIAVGTGIRKWFKSAAQVPEPEPDDVIVTGPLPEFSSAMLEGPHVPEAQRAHQDRAPKAFEALSHQPIDARLTTRGPIKGETRQPLRRATDEVRADDQPQDREGAGADNSADATGPGGSGDSVPLTPPNSAGSQGLQESQQGFPLPAREIQERCGRRGPLSAVLDDRALEG
jgi:hypothetical protein